jgi:hypothetical protein
VIVVIVCLRETVEPQIGFPLGKRLFSLFSPSAGHGIRLPFFNYLGNYSALVINFNMERKNVKEKEWDSRKNGKGGGSGILILDGGSWQKG